MYKNKLQQLENDFESVLPKFKQVLDNYDEQLLKSEEQIEPTFKISKYIQCSSYKEIQIDHYEFFETSNLLIYAFFAFVRKETETNTQIDLVYFLKKSGNCQFKKLGDVTGKQTTSKFMYTYVEGNKGNFQPIISLMIGTQHGILKMFTIGPKLGFYEYKIHTVPINWIQSVEQNETYSHRNLVLVLCNDQTIFLIEIIKRVTIAIFKDGRIPLGNPLKVKFHRTYRYFMQVNGDGCIKIWDINQDLVQKIEEVVGNSIKRDTIVKKYYAITPLYSFHSAAIDGLNDAGFFGDLIALVTKSNIFRLIVVDFTALQTYLLLAEIKIQGAQAKKMLIFDKDNYVMISQKDAILKVKLDCEKTLRIAKLQQYKFEKIKNISQFMLSKNQIYISILSQKCFYISKQESAFKF